MRAGDRGRGTPSARAVALVARPLAYPPARRGGRLMRLLVLGLLLALVSTVEALDVSVAPYQESRRAGALGIVAGRVAAEPRTVQAAARPLTGTTVMLMPRSE